MTRVRNLTASACFSVLAVSSMGCVSGMQYKMPMPSSLTLGTIREEGATLAGARARHAKPAVPSGTPVSGPRVLGGGVPNGTEQQPSSLVMLR